MPTLDISMPLFPGMPRFPGDPALAVDPVARLARGDPYNLSRLTLGSHAGTHLDPPRHFDDDAPSTDLLDLDRLSGPCLVLSLASAIRRIGPEHLVGIPEGTARVLFRTSNSERWARSLEFFDDYVTLSLAAAAELVRRNVGLVGIDALSVERDPEARFPVHRELLGHGVPILEGLLLGRAAPGPHELLCLPLALREGDGGPARAALR